MTSFKGFPAPPPGWRRSVLRAGDTLASLAAESGVSATELGKVNGVPFPGSKTCAWGNAIGDMAVASGGGVFREGTSIELDASKRNRALCGRDCRFKGGSVINLPVGVRPAAPEIPSKAIPPKKSSKGGLVAVVLGLLAAGAAAFSSSPKQGG
jgi:hypothetical protein